MLHRSHIMIFPNQAITEPFLLNNWGQFDDTLKQELNTAFEMKAAIDANLPALLAQETAPVEFVLSPAKQAMWPQMKPERRRRELMKPMQQAMMNASLAVPN